MTTLRKFSLAYGLIWVTNEQLETGIYEENATSCSLVHRYRDFEGICCLHLQSEKCTYLPNCTSSHAGENLILNAVRTSDLTHSRNFIFHVTRTLQFTEYR